MNQPGRHTYHEIVSQPEAWQQALAAARAAQPEVAALWKGSRAVPVVFTGCGSTYYLSLAAAALFQMLTGRPARAIPAGELLLYPEVTYLEAAPAVLVAISRSGTTTETVEAVARFKRADRGPVVAITNDGNAPLAGTGDLILAIPAGQEQSVAQTRSFASLYVAASAFAALSAGREELVHAMERLPAVGDRLLHKYAPLAQETGEMTALDRFYFLGSGPRYGLACEVNLKMKEMTLTHSEPFHFFEFRHGPMSMVGETSAVIGLCSMAHASLEQAVLDEMHALGACTLSLGEQGTGVAFASGLPEEVRNVLYLPVLQLMAYYRALAKGLDPDNPRHLSAVVHLDARALGRRD
ncbi:MAG: SIS domain-containing protein [Anaerolineae bacterium]|nr:SIS domain-containing protein [Anaerolineae bacterium]